MQIRKQIPSLLVFCMVGVTGVFAQDPGGTQFSNSPLYYNPAFTGLYKGMHVRLSTRNQGPALETTLRSYHLSADIADRNLPGSGGIGLIFNSDNEGVGFIKNYNLGVSFSARVPLARSIIGQVGVKIDWFHKQIAWEDFAMSEKIHERYNNIYDSGFIRPDVNTLNMPDFAIGGLVQMVNGKGCLSVTAGLAVDHLFEPDESFLPTEIARLPRRWTGHADLIWAVKCPSMVLKSRDDVWKINPAIIFQHQGELNALQAGFNGTKSGLYAGVWYKGAFGPYTSNSLALLGGYRYTFAENMSLKFTYSYDKPVSGALKTSGGAHEISLVLEFDNLKLFKGSGGSSTQSSSAEVYDFRLSRLEF